MKKFLLSLFHLIKMWCQWMRTTANRQMRSGVKGVFCLPKMKKSLCSPSPPRPHFVLFFNASHFLCLCKRVSPCRPPAAERLHGSDRDASSDHQITFAPYNCQDKEPICGSLYQKGVRWVALQISRVRGGGSSQRKKRGVRSLCLRLPLHQHLKQMLSCSQLASDSLSTNQALRSRPQTERRRWGTLAGGRTANQRWVAARWVVCVAFGSVGWFVCRGRATPLTLLTGVETIHLLIEEATQIDAYKYLIF